ncbi:MAG: ThiF family adenylyltransferase [Polyangiales bacterium]
MIDEERLAREALVGWNRDRLEAACVVIAGAGAAGNNLVQALALCHVGELRLVDADRYEASNVSRSPLLGRGQVHHGTVGKAEELARAALVVHGASSPTLRHAHSKIETLGYGAFERADVIVSAVDSFAARGYLATAARRLCIPLVEMGFHEIHGHASFFAHRSASEACFLCFQPRAGVTRAPCSLYARQLERIGRVPATQPLAASVAAFASSFIIRAIHGDVPTSPVVSSVNLESCSAERMTVSRSASCKGHVAPFRNVATIDVNTNANARALFQRLTSMGVEHPQLVLRRRFVAEAGCEKCGAMVHVHRLFDDVTEPPCCASSCAPTPPDVPLTNIVDTVSPDDAIASLPLATFGYGARDVVEIVDAATRTSSAFRLAGSIDDLFSTIRRHVAPSTDSKD